MFLVDVSIGHLVLLGRLHGIYDVQTVVINDSIAWAFVSLSVTQAGCCKRLNGSMSSLGWRLMETQETLC